MVENLYLLHYYYMNMGKTLNHITINDFLMPWQWRALCDFGYAPSYKKLFIYVYVFSFSSKAIKWKEWNFSAFKRIQKANEWKSKESGKWIKKVCCFPFFRNFYFAGKKGKLFFSVFKKYIKRKSKLNF